MTLIRDQYFLEVVLISCKEEGKNLKEHISPSLFPQPQLTTKSQSMVSKCGKKCDIFDNFLVRRNEFTCKVRGKTYKIGGNLLYNSANVVYLLSCRLCKNQYVGYVCCLMGYYVA